MLFRSLFLFRSRHVGFPLPNPGSEGRRRRLIHLLIMLHLCVSIDLF